MAGTGATETATKATLPVCQVPRTSELGESKSRKEVRDVYFIGTSIIVVATNDRMSMFDYIAPDWIPLQGQVFSGISEQTKNIVADQTKDSKDIAVKFAVPRAELVMKHGLSLTDTGNGEKGQLHIVGQASMLTGGCRVARSDMPHLAILNKELAKSNVQNQIRILVVAQKQPGRLVQTVCIYNKSVEPFMLVGCAGGTDPLSGSACCLSWPPDGMTTSRRRLTNPHGSANAVIPPPQHLGADPAGERSFIDQIDKDLDLIEEQVAHIAPETAPGPAAVAVDEPQHSQEKPEAEVTLPTLLQAALAPAEKPQLLTPSRSSELVTTSRPILSLPSTSAHHEQAVVDDADPPADLHPTKIQVALRRIRGCLQFFKPRVGQDDRVTASTNPSPMQQMQGQLWLWTPDRTWLRRWGDVSGFELRLCPCEGYESHRHALTSISLLGSTVLSLANSSSKEAKIIMERGFATSGIEIRDQFGIEVVVISVSREHEYASWLQALTDASVTAGGRFQSTVGYLTSLKKARAAADLRRRQQQQQQQMQMLLALALLLPLLWPVGPLLAASALLQVWAGVPSWQQQQQEGPQHRHFPFLGQPSLCHFPCPRPSARQSAGLLGEGPFWPRRHQIRSLHLFPFLCLFLSRVFSPSLQRTESRSKVAPSKRKLSCQSCQKSAGGSPTARPTSTEVVLKRVGKVRAGFRIVAARPPHSIVAFESMNRPLCPSS